MLHANLSKPIRCFNPCHAVCPLAAALKMLWSVEAERIRALTLGREGYTAAQYADAAIQLLDAKHHAVPEQDM